MLKALDRKRGKRSDRERETILKKTRQREDKEHKLISK